MSIILSKKHGIAPILSQCFLCGGDKNEIALMGSRANKLEDEFGNLPQRAVFDKEPCEQCQEYMKQGIILIGSHDPKGENRTGHFMVMKDEAALSLLDEGFHASILKGRVCFISPEVAEMIYTQNKAFEAEDA